MLRDGPSTWEVPEPLETAEVRVDSSTTIILRRHGNPDGRRLILSHGNGLAIDLYYPFWSLLRADFDLIVHDLRNHGWNDLGDQRDHTFPTFVRDHDRVLDAVDVHFGPKPRIGVFHSISALAALLSPARGATYDALVLFDPPLRMPGRSYEDFETVIRKTAALTRRRTPSFTTRAESVANFSRSARFRATVPGFPELLAHTTLRPSATAAGFELRCPRDYEAQIIEYAAVFSAAVELGEMVCPVKVIGADPTVPSSYLPSEDLREIVMVDYDFVPDATHFLQVENPGACVTNMLAFLDSLPSI